MTDPLLPHHRRALETDSGLTPGVIERRGYRSVTDPAQLAELGFGGAQLIVPTLLIPTRGVDGDVVSHQHRPDEPRTDERGKPVKYESLPGAAPRLDVSPAAHASIGDVGIPLWITEGAKKADAAAVRGLCCIALTGVWNWRGRNSSGGSTELADWERVNVKGRVVYLAFDSDVTTKPAVLGALRRLAGLLKRRGAKDVRPVVIPAREGEKVGLDDYFARGGTVGELLGHVDKDILRPVGIVVNNRGLAEITADAMEAILDANDPPSVFVCAGEIVRIKVDERSIAKIEPLSHASLRGVLARCATWVRATKDGPIEGSPPMDAVEDLLSLGQWATVGASGRDLPPVEAITRAPVLASDGSISMAPGYCPKSRFYVASRETWSGWTGSLSEAVEFLARDVLGDFPFAGDADRAHALALMLLPIVRPAIDGPTPLHLIDAPVQGTGKSLLGKICLMPTVGDKVSATTGTKDEEEWRKKIASSLLEGRTYVFLDNLSRKVDSDALAGVLTATEWNDRALSTMRNINVPVRCAWVATANNAELSRDILRRTAWIRLDARVERPEDRTQFRHENLEQWMSANRTRIVAALCALVTAWTTAGRPGCTGRILGSFEEWSKTMGGILETCGVRGFLGNVAELRAAANTDDAAWGDFYRRWHMHFPTDGVKAGMLLPLFEEDESLAGLLGDKGENSRKTRLGHLLKKRIGVVAAGLRVEKHDDPSSSISYRIDRVWGSQTQTLSQTLMADLNLNRPENEGLEGLEGFSEPSARTQAHTPALPVHTHTRKEGSEKPSKPSKPSDLNLNSGIGFGLGGENPPSNPTDLIAEVTL